MTETAFVLIVRLVFHAMDENRIFAAELANRSPLRLASTVQQLGVSIN